jgi:hypothetical protein
MFHRPVCVPTEQVPPTVTSRSVGTAGLTSSNKEFSCLSVARFSEAARRFTGRLKVKIVGTASPRSLRSISIPNSFCWRRFSKHEDSKWAEQTRAFSSLVGGSTSFRLDNYCLRRLGSLGRRWRLIPGQILSVLLLQPKAMQYGMIVPGCAYPRT